MANVQQITREYLLRATTQGMAETIAAARALGVNQDELAANLAKVSKSSESAQRALERHTRSLDQAYRSSQQFATVQRDLERAQAQGLISSARQAELMALASNRYQQGSTASKAFEKSLSGVSGQLIALSAGAGPVGVFLSALGPWGVAAAVGIGGLAAAFNLAKEAAERMGEKAVALRQVLEVTGLTVEQFGALKRSAAELGFGGDEVTRIMQRLTANMNDTRRASGGLFEDVRKLGGGLSEQLRAAKTETEFINALAAAYKAAGDQATRAEIAKAVGGRGGIGTAGAILKGVGDAGGLDELARRKQSVVITKEEVEALAQMQSRIDYLRKNTAGIWDSLAAKDTLAIMLQYEERMNGMAKAAKQLADQKEGLSAWQKFWVGVASIHGSPNPDFNEKVANLARQKPQGQISQDFSDLGKQEAVVDSLAVGMEKLAARYRAVIDPAAGAAQSLREMQEAAAGDAKIERERIGVLGSAATIEEQRKAKLLDLKSAYLDQKLGASESTKAQELYNRAISAANLDALIQAESRRIGILGNLASVQDHEALQLNQIKKARAEGIDLSRQEIAAILERTRIQAQAAKPENQVALERELLGLSQEEGAIRQKLIGWGIDYNGVRGKALTVEMREIDLLKKIKDLTADFASSFLQGMQQGKSAAESLGNALSKVGQQMTQVGTKSLVDSLFKGASGGGFSFDPVSLGIGAAGGLLSLASSLFDNKAKKAHDEAIDAWHQMADQFHRLVTDLSGLKIGSLQQSLEDATAKAQPIYSAALKAGDTGAMQQIADALVKFYAVERKQFNESFEGTIASLNSGLGPDSPFAEGADRVRKLSDAVEGFLSDTINTLGGGTAAATRAADASAKYLLSLLQVAPALSDAQKELQSLNGMASQLSAGLQALGMSAEDAAAAISTHLAAAVDQLRASFTDDLNHKINEASGAGFVNSFLDLFTQIDQMKATAGQLGVGTGGIDTLFGLSAQKIVDDAHLTGAAFESLVAGFPVLQGVVHAFAADLARSTDEIAKTRQSFQDQLFVLGQDQNTVAGALAIFDLQAQRAREEEVAKGGQALVDLEALQGAQRLQIQQRFADQAIAEAQRAADEQKRILQEAQDFVAGIARRIVDYLNNFLSGSQSPLSPSARLAQAQGAWSSQLSLAQTAGPGQRDALNAITQYHQDLVAATRGYYGSSAAGQSIISAATSQLQALPGQISAEQFIVNAITAQTTSLSSILQSGNPQAIAAALLPQFNLLDTNVNGLLSQSEFVSGLHGMASDSALTTMFKTLDTDNSGSLSRLELINASAGSLLSPASTTATQTTAMATQLLALAQISSNTLAGTNRLSLILNDLDNLFSQNGLIIQNLRSQNQAWAPSPYSPIAFFKGGGYVDGVGSGTSDSNWARLSHGEGVIRASVVSALGGRGFVDNLNRGILPANDNHAIIGAGSSPDLSGLRAEIAEIKKILMRGFDGLASVSSDGTEAIATRLDRANDIASDGNRRVRREKAKTG